ncbi:MAG: CocE/NonD family hydrolase [Actinomycetes bacterium]
MRARLALGLALTVLTSVAVTFAPQSHAASTIQYVRMDDGVQIAVSVHYPKGYRRGQRLPSVLEMSGYDGAAAQDKTVIGQDEDRLGLPNDGVVSNLSSMLDSHYFVDDGYVVVEASIRGTGCSGGQFDLYSWRTALDGRDVIEWMAHQPWSDGKVGLLGHSYSGITGFMIAATRPPHLVAASLSGLIDDVYRGISYPGGVPNNGFPLIWASGYRLALDLAGGTVQPIVRDRDPHCVANQARKSRSVADEPLVNGLADDTDGPWFREHSLYPLAHLINVPTWIWSGYDDEQTGPRGPDHLWEMVKGVPKRLLTGNSDHDGWWNTPAVWTDRVAWMDHWMGRRDHGFGTLAQKRTSVATLFEIHDNGKGVLVPTGIKNSRSFPLEDTRWTNYYFGAGGRLRTSRSASGEKPDRYVSGTERYSWSYQAGPTAGSQFEMRSGPDEVAYTSAPFTRNTAMVGPITSDLYLSSTDVDTDMFVQVVDVAPDGSRSYLQRGLLKSSMRAIDYGQSDYTAHGHLYRPWYSDTNHQYVRPGSVQHYLVEVWPVGWVFRPGHRIRVEVHAPPALDSFNSYAAKGRALAINSVLHDRAHPSSITLPLVSLDGVTLDSPVPCGQQYMVRCIPG